MLLGVLCCCCAIVICVCCKKKKKQPPQKIMRPPKAKPPPPPKPQTPPPPLPLAGEPCRGISGVRVTHLGKINKLKPVDDGSDARHIPCLPGSAVEIRKAKGGSADDMPPPPPAALKEFKQQLKHARDLERGGDQRAGKIAETYRALIDSARTATGDSKPPRRRGSTGRD